VTLSFHGAAGTVTGSCQWLTCPGGRFLVDCGLYQGTKTLKQLNYDRFPFDPRMLDFVLLTHAHIDHSGLLPKLARAGFAGPVYATAPTVELLHFMLPDSAGIQESEVERLNRRNAERGRPTVEPIYDRRDADRLLRQLRPVEYDTWIEPAPSVRVRYWNAGHILGAASIEVELAQVEIGTETGARTGSGGNAAPLRLLFSGDIGPDNKLFHPNPDAPADLDYLVCESTYGARSRTRVTVEQRREILRREVAEALHRGGNLLIPAFAVERTQELLADLCTLFTRGQLPRAPVFLDSPLASRATDVFRRHAGALEDLGEAADPFNLPNLHIVGSVEQSQAIDRLRGGAIILAASGMCDAGRIRHHLKHNLWRPDATVLITGFQAVGTLGRLLLEGRTSVRIHGEEVAVKAAIREIDLYSGHADGEELAAWIAARQPIRRAVFLTHGEDEARAALRDRLTALGLDNRHIVLPQLDDTVDLDVDGTLRRRAAPHRLAPETVDRLDWHNDHAQFLLDLRQALDHAADAKAQSVLLRRLKRALAEEGQAHTRPRG
jgi:metallo-beta-lactamase family protein